MAEGTDKPRVVRPRDAASLIPLRRIGGTLHVLMGRRARAHRFLPNFYVFPGGRVDVADADRRVDSALAAADAASVAAQAGSRLAHALAVAAVRETYEETGLVIGRLIEGEIVPALGRLRAVMRAITPTDSPIRFHARFFASMIEPDDGEIRGNGELLDLAWRPIEASLELPLADITEYLLIHVERLLEASPHPHGLALFAYHGPRVEIRAPDRTRRPWVPFAGRKR